MSQNRIILPRRDGLVGEWNLDGSSIDTSGSGNNGTPTNVTYANTDRGYQSQKGNFVSASSSNVLSTSALTLGDAQTFSLWFKTTTTATNSAFLGSWLLGGADYVLGINATSNNGAVRFLITASNGSTQSATERGSGYNDGKWHHFCGTNDGSTQITYVDGKNLGSTSLTITGVNTSTPVAIGAVRYSNSTTGNYTDADIQSVKIYNVALSSLEVRNQYLEGLRKLGGGSLYPQLGEQVKTIWDFYGDGNDIVSGNNLAITSASLSAGRFGQTKSYEFTGTGTYAQSTTTGFSTGTSDFSVHFWVYNGSGTGNKWSNGTTDWGFAFGNSSNANDYILALLSGTSGNGIRVFIGDGGATSNTGDVTTTFTNGAWTHFAIVRDSTSRITIYENGAQIHQSTLTNRTNTANDRFTLNGNLQATPVNGMTATKRYDDIWAYNYALTADQVKALYQLSAREYILPFE